MPMNVYKKLYIIYKKSIGVPIKCVGFSYKCNLYKKIRSVEEKKGHVSGTK